MAWIRRFLDSIPARARRLQSDVAPSDPVIRGAAWGLLVGTLVVLVVKNAERGHGVGSALLLLGVPYALVFAALVAIVVCLAAYAFSVLPRFARLVVVACAFALTTRVFSGALPERLVPTIYVASVSIVLGAAITTLRRRRFAALAFRSRALVVVALLGGLGAIVVAARWLYGSGADNKPAIDAAKATTNTVPQINAPDPSAPGTYAVLTLTYGSGNDLRRPEYGSGAKLVTRAVDGSPFVQGWGGTEAWARRKYWGFDATTMPINAHVWYPDGAGPFPIVLIAHGGHPMHDFSETGYAYLGEHLASHGFIVASVDENFLNSAPWSALGVGSLRGDNAARGYLLLEHLRAFRGWNAEAGSPFQGKVDLDRVALMGHSRGGEAITAAAKLNGLSRAPDNALMKLDFHFGIRALVAIATTDRQYLPGGRPIELDDVNYLALQGSNDGDAEAFHGAQQYERVRLSPSSDTFKAAVYIHRANHGQWNRSWGRTDKSPFPRRNYFNSKPVMPVADQERIGKAYIDAFLEAALLGKKDYLPFFQDHRAGAAWLPDTIFISRFDSSRARILTTYDEDIDPTTTTLAGGRIDAENLTGWREQPLGPPGDVEAHATRAAFLGWDTDALPGVPSYTVTLPPDTTTPAGSTLVLALADANDNPNPRGLRNRDRRGPPHRAWDAAPRPPIDLSIEIVDAAGIASRLPLDRFSLLQAQLEARVWKTGFLPPRPPEAVIQSIAIPLTEFVTAAPSLDPTRIAAIRLVFDRSPAGVVIVDAIGLLPPP